MVKSCCALNCTRRWKKGDKTKFHRFPMDPNLRESWIRATRRGNYKPSNTAVICEEHFGDDDYEINVHGNRVLKKGAVPSHFNFQEEQIFESNSTGKNSTMDQIEIELEEEVKGGQGLNDVEQITASTSQSILKAVARKHLKSFPKVS